MKNLNIGTVKQLERSPLKLVRIIYYKVTTMIEEFYIIEKAYASKFDGRIDLIKTTKEKYEIAVELGERTEEVDFEIAKDYIQKYIVNELI